MSQTRERPEHPYGSYTGTAEWAVIDRALVDLVRNQDIVERTAHEYIVGYLCRALAENAAGAATTGSTSGNMRQ
jgi:hypothetical protein